MSLRLRIFLGNACLLVLSSIVLFGVVFDLAQRVASDQGQAARRVIEQSLERLRQVESSPGSTATGSGNPEREALLEINRILARSPVAQKDLMLETMAWFLGFLLLQVMALVGLSALLARSVARPLERLLDGIHQAGNRQSGYLLPDLPGREFGRIGGAFNQLLVELDAQSALLAEQSRLAAWQEVAGFLSHQLKNPLTAIGFAISNARGAARNSADNTILEESLDIINVEGRRITDLVQRFRASTTCPEPRLEALFLELVLATVRQRMDERALPDGQPCLISWDIRVPAGLAVLADRQLLEEVLVNLCSNSLEAAGGQVGIAIRGWQAASTIHIEFLDTAGPVDQGIFDRILREPFTTKPAGSGLGLMFVRLVMARHGGSISVRREDQGQLVFTLHLPGVA